MYFIVGSWVVGVQAKRTRLPCHVTWQVLVTSASGHAYVTSMGMAFIEARPRRREARVAAGSKGGGCRHALNTITKKYLLNSSTDQ